MVLLRSAYVSTMSSRLEEYMRVQKLLRYDEQKKNSQNRAIHDAYTEIVCGFSGTELLWRQESYDHMDTCSWRMEFDPH